MAATRRGSAGAAGKSSTNGSGTGGAKATTKSSRSSSLPLTLALLFPIVLALAAVIVPSLLHPSHLNTALTTLDSAGLTPLSTMLTTLADMGPAGAAARALRIEDTIAHATAAADTCGASQYLSDERVPGFVPLCVTRAGGGALRVVAFVDGRNATEAFACDASYATLRHELETRLKLEEVPVGGHGPDNKYPWEAFSPDGRARVASLEDIAPAEVGASKLTFIFKGGAFIWPGVRIGHKQTVRNLQGIESIEMTTASMRPLVFTMANFLSDGECEHIQEVASPHLSPSPVSLMDHDRGKEDTNWRTSKTYFMPSDNDQTLLDIDQRVSDLTRVPTEWQENAQVLRYEEGQRYDAHHDFFNPIYYQKDQRVLKMTDNGRRNRLVTVFWYLSDVEEGGETNFPRAGGFKGNVDFKSCDIGLSVKPARGKVAMFYSMTPDGQFDDFSLHGACPVKKGLKSAANKWVWNRGGAF